jgi:hypothetical protein
MQMNNGPCTYATVVAGGILVGWLAAYFFLKGRSGQPLQASDTHSRATRAPADDTHRIMGSNALRPTMYAPMAKEAHNNAPVHPKRARLL